MQQNPYNQPNYGQPGGGQPRGTVSLDVIGEAWNLVKPSLGQWVVAILIVGVIAFVCSLVLNLVMMPFAPRQGQQPGPAFFAVALLTRIPLFIIIIALSGGLIKMGISQVKTGVASLSDLTSVTTVIGPLLVASILVGLITNIGMLLCIVPGVIAGLGLCMTQPLIIDQGMSAIDAMKRSWDTCKPHLGSIFVLFIVIWLVNLVGAIPCGLGLLITYPISIVAISLVYRDLFGIGGVGGQNMGGYNPPPIANPNY
ncbi:hypothetical protein EON83_16070 [bacterium]|nr:MAG: hypothetical protein EON83_16070 [bacterium]